VAGKLGLGQVGVALNVSDAYLANAAEVERLGYTGIWLPGGQIGALSRLASVIQATSAIQVGSAIIPFDVYSPEMISGFYADVERTEPGRLVVGLGGPQAPRPMRALNGLLDMLDRSQPPVPARRRLLAALGPRKLELARDRAAGAILLLVTPAYVSTARQILGSEAALVLDQMIVLDDDPDRARTTARRALRFLSRLPGYATSFTRMGFADSDIAAASDGILDSLIIWGDEGAISAQVKELLAAGADHVFLQVLSDDMQPGPVEAARRLSDSLLT
jgi:probable F420-dependent oxidoreductase